MFILAQTYQSEEDEDKKGKKQGKELKRSSGSAKLTQSRRNYRHRHRGDTASDMLLVKSSQQRRQ